MGYNRELPRGLPIQLPVNYYVDQAAPYDMAGTPFNQAEKRRQIYGTLFEPGK